MGAAIRLFVASPLRQGVAVPATSGQAHYLGTVMRLRPGDPVRLFNGRDGEWLGRLDALRRAEAALVPERPIRPQAPEPDLWLLFALLKRDATDLVARAATELGVSRLMPVLTERTNAARANLDRLALIAAEAAEQSERLTVPEVAAPARLPDLLAAWPDGRRLAVAAERVVPYPGDAAAKPAASSGAEPRADPRPDLGADPAAAPRPEWGAARATGSRADPRAASLSRPKAEPWAEPWIEPWAVPWAEASPDSSPRPGGEPPPRALLVGPEGGFTGAELDALRRRPFVVTISLGPRILRAETAVIAGLALLQAGAWAGGARPS